MAGEGGVEEPAETLGVGVGEFLFGQAVGGVEDRGVDADPEQLHGVPGGPHRAGWG